MRTLLQGVQPGLPALSVFIVRNFVPGIKQRCYEVY
nr:MAG TPA: hypothetical protein [Caudoviricetes sp.]